MSWADCPHCGERNFSFLAAVELDRCAGCGRPLATDVRRAVLEPRVRETIASRQPATDKRSKKATTPVRTGRFDPEKAKSPLSKA